MPRTREESTEIIAYIVKSRDILAGDFKTLWQNLIDLLDGRDNTIADMLRKFFHPLISRYEGEFLLRKKRMDKVYMEPSELGKTSYDDNYLIARRSNILENACEIGGFFPINDGHVEG